MNTTTSQSILPSRLKILLTLCFHINQNRTPTRDDYTTDNPHIILYPHPHTRLSITCCVLRIRCGLDCLRGRVRFVSGRWGMRYIAGLSRYVECHWRTGWAVRVCIVGYLWRFGDAGLRLDTVVSMLDSRD